MTSVATRVAGVRVPRPTGGWWGAVAAVLLALGAGAGCAKARAASVPEAPPLVVPAPPPRVLVPAEEEPLAARNAGPDTTVSAVELPAVQPPAPRARRPQASTPEPPSAPPAAAAAPASAVTEAPRELRAVAAPDQQRIEAIIGRAEKDLEGLDPGKLAGAQLVAFNDARRFLKEATEALKQRNLLRASESADKAERLAAALKAAR